MLDQLFVHVDDIDCLSALLQPRPCAMAEDALALSLDDIIKRNRDSSKQQPKGKGRDEGGRRGRGAARKNGGTARVAVVSTVQTKRTAIRGRRGGASGTFKDYDGTLFEARIRIRLYLLGTPPPSHLSLLPPLLPGCVRGRAAVGNNVTPDENRTRSQLLDVQRWTQRRGALSMLP